MTILKHIPSLIRSPFLILTPACAAVGIAASYWETKHFDFFNIFLVLLGALSAHISVNVFNEYYDFRSGLDERTRPTPFSGGSGTLPAHPWLENAAHLTAWAAFGITALIGGYFTWLQGWGLVPVGLLGLLLLVTYSTWWFSHPMLALAAPGLGFGILLVMGSHFALTGFYSWTSFFAALVPTFLVSNLLLLNQFPDVEADQSIGRKHFPITIGRKASSRIYGVVLALAYLSVVLGVVVKLLPLSSLSALLTIFIAYGTYRRVSRHPEDIPALIPAMGMNVVITLTTPVLLAIGLFLT